MTVLTQISIDKNIRLTSFTTCNITILINFYQVIIKCVITKSSIHVSIYSRSCFCRLTNCDCNIFSTELYWGSGKDSSSF